MSVDKEMEDRRALSEYLETQYPTSCYVQYRVAVNDAVVHPWSILKYIEPPTLHGLIAHLKHTDLVDNYYPELLVLGVNLTSNRVVEYGARRQFLLPEAPTQEDIKELEILKKEKSVLMLEERCIYCGGNSMYVESRQGLDLFKEDVYYVTCSLCKNIFDKKYPEYVTEFSVIEAYNKVVKKIIR